MGTNNFLFLILVPDSSEFSALDSSEIEVENSGEGRTPVELGSFVCLGWQLSVDFTTRT